MLDVKGFVFSLLGVGGGGKLNDLVVVCSVFYWVYLFYIIFYKKKKHSKSVEAVSQPRINFQWFRLLTLFSLILSLFLRFFSRPPFVPFMIVCNFLSEIPMLVLFLLICTGWPLVKKPLQKSNLVAVGVFFIELILVPYFVPDDIYNRNQYFESFNLFKFVLVFQALKSSTAYLKKKGMGMGIDEASINVYNTKLFRSMVFYYPLYLALRAILVGYFFFNYSPYSLYINEYLSLALNELLSFTFFLVMACR